MALQGLRKDGHDFAINPRIRLLIPMLLGHYRVASTLPHAESELRMLRMSMIKSGVRWE